MTKIGGFLVCLLWTAAAAAAPNDTEYDAQLTRELQGENPAAVAPWQAANEAREHADWATASAAYAKVYALTPTFVHALRREASAEDRLGHVDQAIKLGEKAVAQVESAENFIVLASIYENNKSYALAKKYADLAERAAPKNLDAVALVCAVDVDRQEFEAFKDCLARLRAIAPDAVETHYMATLAAVLNEDYTTAHAEVAAVRAAGGDPARCDALDKFVTDNTPFYRRWWPRVWRVALAWSLAVLVLLGLGVTLSAATLRQTANVSRATTGRARGGERLLRQIYGGVIALSCALYYVSLPLMLVTVIGLGGGIIYACFAFGHIPIKLVLIVLVATVVTVWSVLKSLFIRRTDADPGVLLDLKTEPGLRELLDEVAAKVGTRAVDNVYVTPGTELAVMERGGMLKSMRGQTERCLILGIGLLDGLKVGELKSLLAHEYGHFSNEDTAGGRLSLHVRHSIITMAHNLVRGGAAGNYNPAWLFVTNYYKIFLRISQGSSRLQEVLADRWAAVSYGSRAFVSGFRHVMRRSAQFEHHVGLTVNEVVKLQRPLANLYAYQPEGVVHEAIEQKLETALAAAASPYDSHPAPAARLAWVRALAIEIAPSPRDDIDAWMIFRDRAALESRMTVEVRENVWRNHSVKIAAPDPT